MFSFHLFLFPFLILSLQNSYEDSITLQCIFCVFVPIPPHCCLLLLFRLASAMRSVYLTQACSKSGNEYVKAVCCHPAYLTYVQSIKAERRIDAFELWCWRRLLKVYWTSRRLNQSTLRKISPEYSLEGLMLKLKLQYFGHLM